jgi:hypothetical protein
LPKPWKLEEQDESFQIREAADRILAYVYFEDEPTRRNFSKRLSKDDARWLAQQILRLGWKKKLPMFGLVAGRKEQPRPTGTGAGRG